MVADPHRHFMSVEEYLELDRTSPDARYEFIDGVVTMLAGGTANHSLIAANIISSLHTLLRGQACRTYTSDMRVNIAGNRYVYPDVTVSCDERDLGAVETLHYPSLIVEVLSASTEAYDRGRKFGYYRSFATLQEYVLVGTQEQAVDLFRRETADLWTFHAFRAGEMVILKSIAVSVPIEDFYENIVWPEETDTSRP